MAHYCCVKLNFFFFFFFDAMNRFLSFLLSFFLFLSYFTFWGCKTGLSNSHTHRDRHIHRKGKKEVNGRLYGLRFGYETMFIFILSKKLIGRDGVKHVIEYCGKQGQNIMDMIENKMKHIEIVSRDDGVRSD